MADASTPLRTGRADEWLDAENLKRLGQAFMAALEKKALAQSNRNAFEKLSILSRAVE